MSSCIFRNLERPINRKLSNDNTKFLSNFFKHYKYKKRAIDISTYILCYSIIFNCTPLNGSPKEFQVIHQKSGTWAFVSISLTVTPCHSCTTLSIRHLRLHTIITLIPLI